MQQSGLVSLGGDVDPREPEIAGGRFEVSLCGEFAERHGEIAEGGTAEGDSAAMVDHSSERVVLPPPERRE